MPTVNVTKAFEDSSDSLESLTKDDGQPSVTGSRLWADTVAAALS